MLLMSLHRFGRDQAERIADAAGANHHDTTAPGAAAAAAALLLRLTEPNGGYPPTSGTDKARQI